MKNRYNLAEKICRFFPPILAQSVRNVLISIKDGEKLNLGFKKKSFTGSYFVGNTSDFHAFKFSIHGYFDWRNIVIANEVLKFRNGGDIIEVGANIGTETLSFCDIANKYDSQVIAFEPLPLNVATIIKNKVHNNLKNLVLHECLVSNKPGKAHFSVPTGNNSGSGYISNFTKKNNIKEFDVVTLDKIVNSKRVSVICIDVEGLEYQVLKGSEDIIKQFRPVIILEVNKRYLELRGQIKFEDFCDYMSKLGYNCFSIDKLGISKVSFDSHKVQSNKNWVCIHNEDSMSHKKLNRRLWILAMNPFMRINNKKTNH